jgi:hypothetical protein
MGGRNLPNLAVWEHLPAQEHLSRPPEFAGFLRQRLYEE